MKSLYIFDIDGTIANLSHRLHHVRQGLEDHERQENDPNWKPDWDAFFGDVLDDAPIPEVIHTLHSLSDTNDIIFFSGRSETAREDTVMWLKRHVGLHAEQYPLFMRMAGDRRQDYIVKKEMYDSLTQYNKDRLIAIFDDRDQVVNMWRNIGVKCYQVAPGEF